MPRGMKLAYDFAIADKLALDQQVTPAREQGRDDFTLVGVQRPQLRYRSQYGGPATSKCQRAGCTDLGERGARHVSHATFRLSRIKVTALCSQDFGAINGVGVKRASGLAHIRGAQVEF